MCVDNIFLFLFFFFGEKKFTSFGTFSSINVIVNSVEKLKVIPPS